MDKGVKKFKFNRMFGLRFTDRLDDTYYSIFVFTVLLIALIILRLATLDYTPFKQKAEKEINHRYKAFISELIVNETKTIRPHLKGVTQVIIPAPIKLNHPGKSATIIVKPNLAKQRQKLTKRIIRENTILNRTRMIGKAGTAQAIANGLPQGLNDFSDIEEIKEADLLAQEDAREAERRIRARAKAAASLYEAKITQVNNFDPGDLTKGDVNLFNYVVERKGSAYLDVPEQLIKDSPAHQGYRDPEEIEKVVQHYSPMIDYCFRKHTRFSPNTKGFIQVAFKISYEGYVIPESVRIISSSLKNKPLEECIKRYIKYWRDFKPLDPSMGIAQVVQKFVFN